VKFRERVVAEGVKVYSKEATTHVS
jgi:hypothetical protein